MKGLSYNMNDQKRLFRQIQIYSFVIYETALYLDGHPYDRRALEYYNRYNTKLLELTDRYERKYGPLTIFGGQCGDEWKWVDSPWPWEYDACN